MSDSRAIGVFDSGVGGLTVVRSIIDDLPHESIFYFGDTGRYPYGPLPLDTIRTYAVQIANHLLDLDVKLMVVACNSATAAALDEVTAAVPVPVIGVIEPAVRAAVRATRNGRVGLIGTEATVSSGAYQLAMARFGPEAARIELVAQACPLFVEFVERGDTTSEALLSIAARYLAPLRVAAVDTLILGCTHYPLLRGTLGHVMGDDVLLLSSADETARDVYQALTERSMLNESGSDPSYRFESSGDPSLFSELGRRFLGPEVIGASHVSFEPVGKV